MSKIDGMKFYKSLSKETQELITNVMFSTIDMCNELLDTKLVFFEDVAYRAMRGEMLDHMLKSEWFDALGDRTWKQKDEVTSWNGKISGIKKENLKSENKSETEQKPDSSPRYIKFTKEIDYWVQMIELNRKTYDVLDDYTSLSELHKEWPTIINEKDEIELIIDITDGRITNWPPNKTGAFYTVKIVDTGHYELLSEDRTVLKTLDGYVPRFLSMEDYDSDDYLNFGVDLNGHIENWKFSEENLKIINETWINPE